MNGPLKTRKGSRCTNVPSVALNGGYNLDTMAKTHTCEIAGCDRACEMDVPSTDRDGNPTTLVVCEPCHNAYMAGANDPNV